MKNEVRIIGGVWRGRKIQFPDAPGLRPTPDRVRETLFNWLGQDLEGLACLNLYAGSGALGFEAASRGARRVVQVERNADICTALKLTCERLNARSVQILQKDVSWYLKGKPEVFDVVFLDAPFHLNLIEPCCQLLEQRGWLALNARLYIEAEKEKTFERLPTDWQPHRSKQAGGVGYHLFQRMPSSCSVDALC